MDSIKTYTLSAQTPMIHFQTDHVGATLRATEVKPKLDRFLRQRAERTGLPLKGWQISDRHDALAYKMRIIATSQAGSFDLKKDQKFYFGNMGVGPQKDAVYRNCQLQIICFIPALLAFIDENIAAFFVLHNFGTRQSKGFGGFLVEGRSNNAQIRQIIEAEHKHFFYTDLPRGTDAKTGLAHALTVYTFLKNGTNQTRYDATVDRYLYPNRYIRGFSRRSFLPETVGSDKAFLKSKVVPAKIHRGKDLPQTYDSYVFIRALLGLADHYDFRDDMRNGGTNYNGKLRPLTIDVVHFDGTQIHDGKPVIPLSSLRQKTGIRRFRSPILIKIFSDRIFFILDDSYQLMLSQVFLFMKNSDHKNADRLIRTDITQAQRMFQQAHCLSTPQTFDPDDFITRFIEYFNEHRGKLSAFPDLSNSSQLILTKGGAGGNG